MKGIIAATMAMTVKEGIAFPNNSVVNERSGERQSEGDSSGILTALAS